MVMIIIDSDSRICGDSNRNDGNDHNNNSPYDKSHCYGNGKKGNDNINGSDDDEHIDCYRNSANPIDNNNKTI